jgi:hypothetical protein
MMRKNFKSEIELKHTYRHSKSIDNVMSSNDLFEETITFTKVAKVLKDKTCNKLNCLPPFGKCSDKNTCECREWYFDVPFLLDSQNLFCRYRQKSQAVSLVLEILSLSGIGHIYSGRSVIGLIKLSFTIIIMIVIHFMRTHIPSETGEEERDRNGNRETTNTNKILKYLPNILLFLFFSAQIVDLFLIGRNFYSDGYGIPMKKIDFYRK